MSLKVQKFKKWYADIRKDPIAFAEMALRCIDEDIDGPNNPKLTKQQRGLLECVKQETFLPLDQRKKRITVKSGKGTGKTTCEVIIALWRVFQGVDNLVIVTAPTFVQVQDVWFAELRRILERSHPFIKSACSLTAKKCKIFRHEQWGIWGRTANKEANFQGYHDKRLTFIVDEASGVERHIIRAIKTTLTNSDSLMICAGNPNIRECAFFDMFYKPSEAPLWHKFTFNSEDSPITDKENIRRIAEEFGVESDSYRVSVLGEFPLADPNCIMSTGDLWACTGVPKLQAAAMRRDMQVENAISIDFARFGGDESVIMRRSGHAVMEMQIFVKTEPIAVVEAAMKMQARSNWRDRDCCYIVDAGGIGQGIVGILHRAGKRVHEFHTQGKASDRAYANKMTEAYFNLAKLAKKRRLHIPSDELLVHQLTSRLYSTDPKGKLLIEKKDNFLKRQEGMSPDRADALAMLFYNAVMARGRAA